MSSQHDLDPAALEDMRRMAYDRSKWLQTCTAEITKYEYNKEELNGFFGELQEVIGRVKSSIYCQLCKKFPKKSFILRCGHNFCAKCSSKSWNQQPTSTCPKCKLTFDEQATPFYALDTIVTEMTLFNKESKYLQNSKYVATKLDESQEGKKKLKSMHFVLLQRLKNIECSVMCDLCFNRIQKTFLINCSSDAFTFRPFCEGCDAKYITFYEREHGKKLRSSFRFENFDFAVKEFYEFLDKMVDYSKINKVPRRFLSSNGHISFIPIYKMLAGMTIIGLILLYYSS